MGDTRLVAPAKDTAEGEWPPRTVLPGAVLMAQLLPSPQGPLSLLGSAGKEKGPF